MFYVGVVIADAADFKLFCWVGGGVDLCLSDVVVQVMSVLFYFIFWLVVVVSLWVGGGGLSDFCFV